jgi:hypothetical protein
MKAKYVSECDICQRVKASHLRISGTLQPLSIPSWKWEDISMHFIVCLPNTSQRHDSIWVMSVFNQLPTEGYTQGGKFWVRRRRDQELEGARNTKLRQVRAARCVTPYVLYGSLYCLLCRMT